MDTQSKAPRDTTLDQILLMQGDEKSPLSSIPPKPTNRGRVILLLALVVLLILACLRTYVLSVGPVSALTFFIGTLDIFLFVLGFFLAYAYTKRTLNFPMVEVDWRELGPGVLYFVVAKVTVGLLHISPIGLTGITIFGGFGFLTSPGISRQVLDIIFQRLKILFGTWRLKNP